VSELELIASEARQLAEAEEPAQRLWVRIAAELRSEGIIREPEAVHPVVVPSPRRRWNTWWLVPVAVALLAAGSYVLTPKTAPTVATKTPVATPAQPTVSAAPTQVAAKTSAVAAPNAPTHRPKHLEVAPALDDQQFLAEVSQRAPMMRATYENELRSVNSYIQDAQDYADQNPGDAEARQHLMDAYQQKELLYQMALDNIQ